MDADAVRQALARFVGVEKARRFIVAGLRANGSLHYWQQDAWDQFVTANPEFADAVKLLPDVVRYCVVHDEELLPDTIAVVHGCMDRVREYEHDLIQQFPHAAIGPWTTEGRPYEGNTVQVWYCPGCRDAYKKSRWGRPPRSSI